MGIHYITDEELKKITDAIRYKNRMADAEPLNGSELTEQIIKNPVLVASLTNLDNSLPLTIKAEDLQGLSNLRRYAFSYSSVISVQLPQSVKLFVIHVFADSRIKKIEMLANSVSSVSNYSVFSNCFYFHTFILRSESVPTMSSANYFEDTLIGAGKGYVYVPKKSVESYKTATNWLQYASQIKAIEDYEQIEQYVTEQNYTPIVSIDRIVFNILSTFDTEEYPDGFTIENMTDYIEKSGGLSTFESLVFGREILYEFTTTNIDESISGDYALLKVRTEKPRGGLLKKTSNGFDITLENYSGTIDEQEDRYYFVKADNTANFTATAIIKSGEVVLAKVPVIIDLGYETTVEVEENA